ncbi:MAG: tetratricopeptide repeat protein, partial [Phaeodactylibacter sp.]|nr:tetratricopeptide repeat protein [Phaeodactylibacter sp.]
ISQWPCSITIKSSLARSCLNHGAILSYLNNSGEAEKCCLQARSLYEKGLGAENPDYAVYLFELG